MGPSTLVWMWTTITVLQASLIAATTLNRRGTASLWLSAIASIAPLATLSIFTVVFVIGKSSNVAQLAGDEGFGFWQLWLSAWPILFFANPLFLLVCIIAAVLPPYSLKFWTSTIARISAVVCAVLGWYAVITYFPDA